MGGRAAREGRRLPYWVSFAAVTLLLGGLTTAFVLVVLPQRFVLQAGLKASGISFPTRSALFEPAAGVAVAARPRPAPSPSPPAGPTVGPAEAFWDRAGPLLRSERYREVLPLFAEHLDAHPDEAAAWREYGIVLAQLGRGGEAEAALARAVHLNGDERARRELARLLRDGGEVDRALALYRELANERPSDLQLRHELARTLVWAERYDEAAAEYRFLLRAAPGETAYRLELGRALYWAGHAEEASDVLAVIPGDSPEGEEARALQVQLAALLAPDDPPSVSPAEADEDPRQRARRAAAAGELELAAELYRALLRETPEDAALLREWADVLEYRLDDPEGARAALLRSGRLAAPEAEQRLRLARLHAWTGREEESLAALDSLLADEPALAEAWVLRGDLHRWRGARLEAARAYRRALAADPDVEGAREGLWEVDAAAREAMVAGERPGVGPELRFFRDSDGYRRWDLTGRWAATHATGALTARSGYRRLEGFGVGGLRAAEDGPFAEVELSRWWREGTLRAAVTGGAERLEAFGVEPTFGLSVETWNPPGLSLEADYRHGAAYPLATTLESVVEPVRADELRVALRHGLGNGWSAGASGNLASLRGGETDNWRLGGGASLFRRLSPVLRVGVESRLLGYAESAPRLGDRRLYWDPRRFWSTAAALEVALPRRDGWAAHGAVRPGVGVTRERDPETSGTVPQLATEAGVSYRAERVDLSGDLFYLRGREGDYNALGFGLSLSVRP